MAKHLCLDWIWAISSGSVTLFVSHCDKVLWLTVIIPSGSKSTFQKHFFNFTAYIWFKAQQKNNNESEQNNKSEYFKQPHLCSSCTLKVRINTCLTNVNFVERSYTSYEPFACLDQGCERYGPGARSGLANTPIRPTGQLWKMCINFELITVFHTLYSFSYWTPHHNHHHTHNWD